MLKNKILILFIITLFLSCFFTCFFTCSVYASEGNIEKFNFTGFDNKEYTLPVFPEEVNNYNHYVLATSDSSFYLICFNETINIFNNPGLRSVQISCDSDSSFYFARLDNTVSWSGYTTDGSTYIPNTNGSSIIYSCSCLSSYSEILLAVTDNGTNNITTNIKTAITFFNILYLQIFPHRYSAT